MDGDVDEEDTMQHVENLVKVEIICEIKPHEKGLINLVLFIKEEKKGK